MIRTGPSTQKLYVTVTTADGKAIFKLTESFKKEVLSLLRTREQTIQDAIDLRKVFEDYKRCTGNGLPSFVRDHLDPECPGSYGAPGSDNRKKINSNKVFNHVRHLIEKVGRKPASTR